MRINDGFVALRVLDLGYCQAVFHILCVRASALRGHWSAVAVTVVGHFPT